MRGGTVIAAGLLFVGCQGLQDHPGQDALHTSETTEPQSATLRNINIRTRDVFAPEDARKRPLYRFFNWLHVPTKEAVIRRRLWFAEGDAVAGWEVSELERNLRDLGLFGEVSATLEEAGDSGEADLMIDTRDRFSLTSGAGGFFVGGVSGIAASIGERNLFGTGNRISLNYRENSENEESGSVSFTDLHLFDSVARLRVSGGFTEEGSNGSIGLSKPFLNRADEEAWGVAASFENSEVDFFQGGDTVAEVPQDGQDLHLYFLEGAGREDFRTSSGFDLRLANREYGAASGVDAASIDVPGDVERATLGMVWSVDFNHEFVEVEGLDAIDVVEDVPIGARYELFLGAQHRAERGEDSSLMPTALIGLRKALEPTPESLVTLGMSAHSRWRAGSAVSWAASASLHGYYMGDDHQTWAASVTFDQGFEGQDLPFQLTLGEDNGLRGYPSREFAGSKRLRLNLENRIRTDWVVRSVHIGVVPFFDMGFVGEDDLGSARSSVGIGLRFGSSEILGSGVLRMDLAFPLDEQAGEDFGPSLSLSLGQVFSLFGNSSTLPGR